MALQEQAHLLGKKVLGEKHPGTMDALNNIALNLQSLGRMQQSADTYRQVIALRAEALGEEHPRTLRSRQNLATLLMNLGDNRAAVPVLEELAEVRTRVLGGEHPDTLWTQQDLARSYAGLGRLQEAEAMLRVLLEQRVRILGEDHHDSILSRYHLGSVLRRNGKYPEAERQLLKAVDLSQKSEDASAEDILYDQLELGWVYLDSDEIERAATILQTAVEQLDSVDSGSHLYGVVMKAWGETLRRQGELADAERALLDALGVLSSIYEKDNEWVQETATSLVALYTARGQLGEAERYRQLARAVEQP